MGEVDFVSVLLENKALFPAKMLSVSTVNRMRENNIPEQKVFFSFLSFLFFLSFSIFFFLFSFFFFLFSFFFFLFPTEPFFL